MGISRIHVPNKENVSILFWRRLIASINVVTLNDYTLNYSSKLISNFFKLFANVLFEADRTIEFPYSAANGSRGMCFASTLGTASTFIHACMHGVRINGIIIQLSMAFGNKKNVDDAAFEPILDAHLQIAPDANKPNPSPIEDADLVAPHANTSCNPSLVKWNLDEVILIPSDDDEANVNEPIALPSEDADVEETIEIIMMLKVKSLQTKLI
ncbi:hypothetical protein Tco_0343901 [Tanacetum coccineum]